MDEVLGVLKVAPNLIFRLLYKSPLVTYNDIVNDMDFFNSFKFTMNKRVAYMGDHIRKTV